MVVGPQVATVLVGQVVVMVVGSEKVRPRPVVDQTFEAGQIGQPGDRGCGPEAGVHQTGASNTQHIHAAAAAAAAAS